MTDSADPRIEKAAQLLADAQRIVCLTGAGVSAESGVATFRSAETGLWSQFDPQQLASQEGFSADPGLVWRWYMHRLDMVERAWPNAGHDALAALERLVASFTLVTQNVDDLHERAGSRRILHLHGRISRFHCNRCHFEHDLLPGERRASEPPACHNCGGLIRPSVIWFGENLPRRVLDHAWREAERCDLLLVVGTSGVVYPAAHLPFVAKQSGARIIDVNPEPSEISVLADVFLRGPSGELLPLVIQHIRTLQGRTQKQQPLE